MPKQEIIGKGYCHVGRVTGSDEYGVISIQDDASGATIEARFALEDFARLLTNTSVKGEVRFLNADKIGKYREVLHITMPRPPVGCSTYDKDGKARFEEWVKTLVLPDNLGEQGWRLTNLSDFHNPHRYVGDREVTVLVERWIGTPPVEEKAAV